MASCRSSRDLPQKRRCICNKTQHYSTKSYRTIQDYTRRLKNKGERKLTWIHLQNICIADMRLT